MTSETHCRQVSEAALFGKLLTEKWYDNLGLVSDDAPQFKLYGFVHGLIPLTTQHRKAKEQAQDTFWELYKSLQAYRTSATESLRGKIEFRFDQLCQSKTGYPDLKAALGLLHTKRSEFPKLSSRSTPWNW